MNSPGWPTSMNANWTPVTPGIAITDRLIWVMPVSNGALHLFYSEKWRMYELFHCVEVGDHPHSVATFHLNGFQRSWRRMSDNPSISAEETRAALREIAEIIKFSSVHFI